METYVTFETAKLLNKLGYDVLEEHQYTPDGFLITGDPFGYTEESRRSIIPAPTHQTALKQLRDKYNIVIVIEPNTYNYIDEKWSSYVYSIWHGDNYYESRKKDYPTYEEAEEAAMQEVLKYYIKNDILPRNNKR